MTDESGVLLELLENELPLEVEELVEEIQEERGVGVDEAARSLYKLCQEGKVNLYDPNPPNSLFQYLKSWYNLRFWILVLGVALTTISIYGLPQIPPYIYLRYTLGSIFVLYLPGYSLIEALYPKKDDLEAIERLALSIGLSLALVPLMGLLLNYTPWGIRLNPIYTSLTMLTLTLAALALVRKYGYFKLKVEASNAR